MCFKNLCNPDYLHLNLAPERRQKWPHTATCLLQAHEGRTATLQHPGEPSPGQLPPASSAWTDALQRNELALLRAHLRSHLLAFGHPSHQRLHAKQQGRSPGKSSRHAVQPQQGGRSTELSQVLMAELVLRHSEELAPAGQDDLREAARQLLRASKSAGSQGGGAAREVLPGAGATGVGLTGTTALESARSAAAAVEVGRQTSRLK